MKPQRSHSPQQEDGSTDRQIERLVCDLHGLTGDGIRIAAQVRMCHLVTAWCAATIAALDALSASPPRCVRHRTPRGCGAGAGRIQLRGLRDGQR